MTTFTCRTKLMVLLFLFSIVIMPSHIKAGQPPEFQRIDSWISEIQNVNPSLRLIKKEKIEGYFIAVFDTGKDAFAVSTYDVKKQDIASGVAFDFQDENGVTLLDKDRQMLFNARDLCKSYEVQTKESTSIFRKCYGSFFPIKKDYNGKITFVVNITKNTQTRETLPFKSNL